MTNEDRATIDRYVGVIWVLLEQTSGDCSPEAVGSGAAFYLTSIFDLLELHRSGSYAARFRSNQVKETEDDS